MTAPRRYLSTPETANLVYTTPRSIKAALYTQRFLSPDIFLDDREGDDRFGWDKQRLLDWAIWSGRINTEGENLLREGRGPRAGITPHDVAQWDVQPKKFYTLRRISALTGINTETLKVSAWRGQIPGADIVLNNQRGWSEKSLQTITTKLVANA